MRRFPLVLALILSLFAALQQAAPATISIQAKTTLHTAHGMGLVIPANFHPRAVAAAHVDTPPLPPVDFSLGLPPVGDQGDVGSCASWSSAYYLLGWWLNHSPGGQPAGGMAPMSIYSRVTALYDKGQDQGSTLEQPLALIGQYGAAAERAYPQGYFDFTDQPTPAEAANALQYRSGGFHDLWQEGQPGTAQQAIDAALAAGEPVEIGFAVAAAFENATTTTGPLPALIPGEYIFGGHANVIYGRDAAGDYLDINQWGPRWGQQGRITLSPGFLATAVFDVAGMVPGSAPQPSPSPTATSTPVPPTMTPTATATPSPKPSPTVTPTPGLVPWPHAGITGLPAALPKGSYSVLLVVRDSHGVTRALRMIGVTKR